MLSPGQPILCDFVLIAIVFFSFFYTALVFNSLCTLHNLKKSGASFPATA